MQNDGGPSEIPRALQVVTSGGVPLSGASALSVAGNQSCAILTGGVVVCWGGSFTGLTGTPAPVVLTSGAPLTGAVSIAVGVSHACAVLAGGTVACWGNNAQGQLGNGTTMNSAAPVIVTASSGAPLTGVAAVSAGAVHTCAMLTTADVECWGDNSNGELGDGTTNSSPTPVAVAW